MQSIGKSQREKGIHAYKEIPLWWRYAETDPAGSNSPVKLD